MKLLLTAAITLLVLTTGCVSNQTTWTHPTHTQSDFHLAQRECINQTEEEVPTPEYFDHLMQILNWRKARTQTFRECMSQFGWEQTPADPRYIPRV